MVYVSVLLFLYLSYLNLKGGAFLVWLIFLCSWGCDTCAYCVGILIGKHKMAPTFKPEKIHPESAVGGVVGAALLGLIYALAAGKFFPEFDHSPAVYADLVR